MHFVLSPQITLSQDSQNDNEIVRIVVFADGTNLPMPEMLFQLLSFLTEPRSFQEIEELFLRKEGQKPNLNMLETVLQELCQRDKIISEVEL